MEYGKGMLVVFGFLCVAVAQGDTIRSMPGGGAWADTGTWEGAAVPGRDDDVVIRGTVTLGDSTACRSLTIADSAVLQNDTHSTGHVTLAVTGSVENKGTIRTVSDSSELWLELFGDCANNGVWTPRRTFFALKDTQIITASPESEFGGALFLTSASGISDSFVLVAGSDLSFNGTAFDCHRRTAADTAQGKLDMAGNQLFLLGSTALSGATLRNTPMITFYDSSTIGDCTFEGNVMISGMCSVIDAHVCFKGDLMLSGGTVQSGPALEPILLRVEGSIINNGLLSNNADGTELWLELHGDIYNAGDWVPGRTYIPQKKRQTISQIAQSRFQGLFFLTRAAGAGEADTFPLVAGSNLLFHGRELQCFKDTLGPPRPGKLDMAGFNLTFSGGAYFEGAVVARTARVTCLDSAMIGETTFLHPVMACGSFKAAMQGVYFNDTLIVVDTLENGSGGCCIANGILFARRGIINNGVIRNNPRQFDLWCQIGGDVVNRGTWINAQNTLTDSVAQMVVLDHSSVIRAPFWFDGMWPEGPYAWHKDGKALSGDSLRLLPLDSLTAVSAGVYRCARSGAWSRAITVVWDSTVRVSRPPTADIPAAQSRRCTKGTQPGVWLLSSGTGDYILRIYDILGRRVFEERGRVTADERFIALPRLGAGTYMVGISTGTRQEAFRIAIAR